ncbi:cobalamin biosynthesis protein [Candidatus Woesearchaeota archaeon]|nr:cobalamin biosynthesis protein [Candidatus Woesearchaeota archaeon]
MSLTIILLAILLDFILREPPEIRFHPLIFLGNLMNGTWRRFKNKNPLIERINGVVYALLFIVPITLVLFFLSNFLISVNRLVYAVFAALLLNYCIAISSFYDCARPVIKALRKNDMKKAREAVKFFVTRETSKLNKEQIVSAVVESIGENICDALIAPLFYFLLFGIAGAAAMKIINLLDGTIGYKTKDKKNIGWFSARLDDIAQFIPARITGILILMISIFIGNLKNTFRILKRDRNKDDGINSGWTIAAMAGILNVQLERPNTYIMGDKKERLSTKKIDKALSLIPLTLIFFLTIFFVLRGMI